MCGIAQVGINEARLPLTYRVIDGLLGRDLELGQHHLATQLGRSGHQMFFRGSHPSFSFPSAVTPGDYARSVI